MLLEIAHSVKKIFNSILFSKLFIKDIQSHLTDIDECAEGLDTCEGEVCFNQPGGYSCAKPLRPLTRRPPTTSTTMPTNQKCSAGMKLVKNRCTDVNECREIEDACTSDEECINTIGSYKCDCKIGFRRENLTQACVDINECQTLVHIFNVYILNNNIGVD